MKIWYFCSFYCIDCTICKFSDFFSYFFLCSIRNHSLFSHRSSTLSRHCIELYIFFWTENIRYFRLFCEFSYSFWTKFTHSTREVFDCFSCTLHKITNCSVLIVHILAKKSTFTSFECFSCSCGSNYRKNLFESTMIVLILLRVRIKVHESIESPFSCHGIEIVH